MNQKYKAPLIKNEFYHLFNRANSKTDLLFYQPRNYHYFLRKWTEYFANQLEVWSYCLMPNHYHFLIRVIHDNPEDISETLRCFSIAYSQAINKQQQRRGSLFQEHPKRLRITTDRHLLSVMRYIHNNPIHHNITNTARNWKFSSYNAFLSSQTTHIKRQQAISLFSNQENFKNFHLQVENTKDVDNWLIDI